MSTSLPLRKYGDQIYQGEVDSVNKILTQFERPNGSGRIYYKNGSIFIGSFKEGKALGEAHYFWPDGSYYKGNVTDNKAND